MSTDPGLQPLRGEFERLGDLPRGVDSRRFLASLLVISRYHIVSRPMSYSNLEWFRSVSGQCDSLLDFLREPGWDFLDAPVEEGLAELDPLGSIVETWLVDRQARRKVRRRWHADYYTRFSNLNVSWSRLTPTDRLRLDDWPVPKRIAVVIGPNIGIGDQLIYFPIVAGLRARFPDARIEAVSFTPSLWDLCPSVVAPTTHAHTLVGPFLLAHEALAADPEALIVFSGFASAPFYRNLETVPGLPRFVFFDSGARCVRIVDQTRGLIREWESDTAESIFRFCCRAMAWLGLGTPTPATYGPVLAVPRGPMSPVRRVYVNPFSSKDHSTIEPTFWAGALDEAAARGPLHATIFAGTSDACRAFARSIAVSIRSPEVTTSLHGEASVPAVADTVRAAVDADASLGLDTYTAHVNVLRASRAVVVFFDPVGGTWDAWRSPHAGVLNASVYDTPAHVGRLLGRLLFDDPRPEVAVILRGIADRRRQLAAMASGALAATARDALAEAHEIAALVREWRGMDPDTADTFGEMGPSLADPLLRVFERAAANLGGPAPIDAPLAKLLADGLRVFEESNLWRYVRFRSSVEESGG